MSGFYAGRAKTFRPGPEGASVAQDFDTIATLERFCAVVSALDPWYARLMIFTKTDVNDVWIVDLEMRADDRGFFARSFDADEFEAHGCKRLILQANVSYNRTRGTLRGMHMQVDPADESKLVRCTKGSIYDAIVDMRPESSTYMRHVGVELTADNHRSLYVPPMFAHGFQTLEDDVEVTYQVGDVYRPGHERGFLYDDPAFGIDWPLPVSVISDKDAAWEPLEGVGAR